MEELLEQLSHTPPAFRDEALAPAVDRDLLWKMARGELDEVSARSVFRLLRSFRSWHEVFTMILLEQFRQGDGDSHLPES